MTNKLKGLFLATLVGLSGQVAAKDGPILDIDVVDDYGRELMEYNSRGQTYVAGQPGQRYNLRVRNNTGERVLAVLSVDGVNILTGQTARTSQQGYVIEPYRDVQIAGWRKSMRNVARFYFTDLGDSYAARTGRPRDVGVIGVAVYQEKPRIIHYENRGYDDRSYERMESQSDQARPAAAPRAPSAANAQKSVAMEGARQEIGTGHGESQTSWASATTFERRSAAPAQVSTIRYDSHQNLQRQGVIRWDRRYERRNEPNAFPGNFVPDPPHY